MDLGPVLTEAERLEIFKQRMQVRYWKYSQATRDRIRELIGMGATYAQVYERVEFQDIDNLRSFCSRHGMKTHRPGRGGNRSRCYPVEEVRRFIGTGAGYQAIAEKFGFPDRHAATAFVLRHKLGPVKLERPGSTSDESIETVRRLVQRRYTVDQIAAMTKWNRNIVSGIIWRYGLRGMKRRPKEFKCVYGKYKRERLPQGKTSPRPEALTAAGPGASPRAPGPVCYSIRGVSLAHV